MELATTADTEEIYQLYKVVIDAVNKTDIRLGWNIDIYPSHSYVEEAINNKEMCILRQDGRIVAAGVVNHNVNKEYDDIDWTVKKPSNRISTIHALATLPTYRGGTTSADMLRNIEDYCRSNGDKAIHLDVIDSNIPAYKLYTRNGYRMVEQISMYYEVVGTREFWMLEKVL